MQKNSSAAAFTRRLERYLTALVWSAFTLAVSAGLLTLCSCASTRAGLEREQALYQLARDSEGTLKRVVPYVPPPASNLLEGALAAGGGLLALWASYLHRRLARLGNGFPGGPPPRGPDLPAPLPAPGPPPPAPLVPAGEV